MINIEVCASSIESIAAAVDGGAKRVELCANFEKGGTTPPQSWIHYSLEYADIQTFTLIRPRESDFIYSEIEFQTMKRDIIDCGKAGAHGVVIGILKADGRVDTSRCKELIDIAKSYNMSVTFHRAIDRSANIMQAMEDIISLGCDRILTSGGKKTAMEGKYIIKEMIDIAQERIRILPGSGISEDNIYELSQYLGVDEYHGSFREKVESKMEYIKTDIDSYESEYTYYTSSAQKIRQAIKNANK